MVGKCWSKFAILVTLEPLIWHFEKKKPTNLTLSSAVSTSNAIIWTKFNKFNYVYGHAFTGKNALFGGFHVDKTYFVYQVTQQDYVMKGSCDFMRGSPS